MEKLYACNLAIESPWFIVSNAFGKSTRTAAAFSFLWRDILHFSINDRSAKAQKAHYSKLFKNRIAISRINLLSLDGIYYLDIEFTKLVSDLHSETKSSRCRGEFCEVGESGWEELKRPFPCCSTNRECLWKKTQIEKIVENEFNMSRSN